MKTNHHLIRKIETLAFLCFSRSSRPEVFCKKGVLVNFAKFTGKYLCQSLFFNKVAEHLFLQNASGGCFCFSFIRFQKQCFYLKVWSLEFFWNLIDFGFKKWCKIKIEVRRKCYEICKKHQNNHKHHLYETRCSYNQKNCQKIIMWMHL